MNSFLSNRKGNIVLFDLVVSIILVLFTFGLLTLIGYLLGVTFLDEFDNSGLNNTDTNFVRERFLGAITMLDNVMILIVVILLLLVGVISFRNASPPIFFLIMFLLGAFLGFVSFFFNFMFSEMVSENTIATVTGVFPNIMLINANLHWIALVAILIGSITAYTRRNTQFEETQ